MNIKRDMYWCCKLYTI